MRTPASGTVLLTIGYGNWIDVALIASSDVTSSPPTLLDGSTSHSPLMETMSSKYFPPASESWIGIPRDTPVM